MHHPSFSSLRIRVLLLVLLAIIPALGLILYTNVEQRRLAAEQVQGEALRLARIAVADEEDSIKDTRQLLFALAQLPQLAGADPAACSTILASLLNQYPQYLLLGAATPDGALFCSAPQAEGPLDVSQRDYFQSALETEDFSIGAYQRDPVSGRATLTFAYPALDQDGQVRAVVFAALDLGWLNQLAAEARLPEGSTFTVIDRHATILVRYPDPGTFVGHSVPEAPIVQTILTRRGEGTAEVTGVDGVPRLFAFSPLSIEPGSEDIYVVVGIPTRQAYASANQVLTRNVVGLGLVTLLALAAAWFGSDLVVVRRVNALAETARRLSGGDLGVRSGLPAGQGELGQLAHAFDEMAASLERRIAERDRAEEALVQATQMLEQQVAGRTRELAALYEVTSVASASLDLETVLERSLHHVLHVMDSRLGAIHLLDETDRHLTLAEWHGVPDEDIPRIAQVPVDDELVGWVIDDSQTVVLPQIVSGPRPVMAISAAESRPYVGAPIRAKGRVLGVLSVVGEAGRQFEREEISLLNSIADQVGVAVENARLYRQAGQLAVMEERQRLARELHDSVTQALYSMNLLAEAGLRLLRAGSLERVEGYMARLGEAAQQALKEMRLMVHELRPPELEREGLVGALQQRLDAVEGRAGVETRLLVEGALDLPAGVEEELYRIAQEALNNALKHASATLVTVRLCAKDARVELEVADNGAGFDPHAAAGRGGLGLVSMRERAERLGGSLAVESAPGQGTKVRVGLMSKT